jgi:hypothetical protein
MDFIPCDAHDVVLDGVDDCKICTFKHCEEECFVVADTSEEAVKHNQEVFSDSNQYYTISVDSVPVDIETFIKQLQNLNLDMMDVYQLLEEIAGYIDPRL